MVDRHIPWLSNSAFPAAPALRVKQLVKERIERQLRLLHGICLLRLDAPDLCHTFHKRVLNITWGERKSKREQRIPIYLRQLSTNGLTGSELRKCVAQQ